MGDKGLNTERVHQLQVSPAVHFHMIKSLTSDPWGEFITLTSDDEENKLFYNGLRVM